MTQRKYKILVVDDEEVTTQLARTLLERHGFEVICSNTGQEGLELARVAHPDLILLDVMLPDIDGFEVCRRIKSDDYTADVPVLMFTARSFLDDVERGREAGADEYIVKPFSGRDLVATIRRHLGLPDA
ncbi:MAG: response regulator [Candidatus Thorarchaeota archaeon]